MTPKLTIQISKTSDGKSDYVQIMDSAGMTVNIVLIADKIEVLDARTSSIPGIKQ